MSSGDLTANCSSSPRKSIAGRSRSQPMNIQEAVPPPPMLTENADEVEKRELAEDFLREVAWHDPYIPNPHLMPREPTGNVDEEKKPTQTESWERMLKEVARHDEDMVKGWRDDIDTLLVFAGLFSAVVTAFAIESYQWLDEDPADTTIALLTQLISVQVNGSQSLSSEPTQFKPDASSIRINVFWFLSLILSLASALFSLLCKQWVREHQRDTTTRTPGEALALRQLRRDSFEKWGVSSFLSALPLLLEVALLFFFVGVLDLLWNRHRVPFVICFVVVSLSVGLYFLTTLLPTLAVPRNQKDDIRNGHFNRLSYQFICPYKSPQAWLVYRLSSTFIRPPLKIPAINDFLRQKVRGLWDHVVSPASDWSSFDLWVVRQFDQYVPLPYIGRPFGLKVYELRAFEWAVTMFRDSPSMILHLQNILRTIPPSVASSAVFGRWDRTMWKPVSMQDVEDVLRHPGSGPSPSPTIPPPILQRPEGINLLFHHQYWTRMVARLIPRNLDKLIDSMKRADLQHSIGLRFVIPFPLVDTLWTHESPTIRAKSLTLLSLFEQSWKPCPGHDEKRHNDERRAFMRALADHITRTGRVSELLTSKRGQAFIRFIHNEAITRRLVFYRGFGGFVDIWSQAIKRVQEVGGLPSDYFAPIPQLQENDLPTLPNLDPMRYSVETERGVQVDNDEVLSIVTSNEMGDVIGVGPSEGSLTRHLHNFGTWLVARRWLPFFSRDGEVSHSDINDNAILGSRTVDSPEKMIHIASHSEPGVDGTPRPTDGDSPQRLGKDDSTKDQTDIGILGYSSNSNRQSGEVGDIGDDSYSLRSLGRHAPSTQNNREHTKSSLDHHSHVS
ncbi:hypothetical protein Moror_2409 [Moniliophthora roreri MCA 2997]|uniref:DUF6535 domain-containing protein n=1 Tax=Moniliophthora roreri (strain MCA 2997) TaxID=1381753 RepID=V2WZ40_MONRO|nr:hypothetical protein Moror_2409 [Moniliophthora roreri MCA 2997]